MNPGGTVSAGLDGRRALVLGVANQRSIAWGIAEKLAAAGARLGFTYQGEKLKDWVQPLVASAKGEFLVPCDVSSDSDVAALFRHVREAWGGLDILVHSIAFAKREDLEGEYLRTSRDGFLLAQEVSAYSLTRLCQEAAPLMSAGGAIVALTYLGGERVVPGYNVMGVAKASLEMSVRYLAADLGPRGIRVNAISAGPVKTLAARGVSGFTQILEIVEKKAPLRRNVALEEIGAAACFLLSGAAGAITGEVLHVDCGFHVLGM
ncbi:MAG: enoyl-ACP reductase [Planctomycetes bacterium]|nr:enoyl-ACP reductase [Planctomycetota bacterium]